MAEPLPLAFYRRDPVVVAQELLNKVLVRGQRQGRIVETEAYGGSSDPASHAFRGLTPRNATMFGPAGHLYVYFTYGMHHCANVVCEEDGIAGAVLLRGLTPLAGLADMYAARPGARRDVDLCNGPAKICQSFALGRSLDGDNLGGLGEVTIFDDTTPPPEPPGVSARIGVSAGAQRPWRFYVPGALGVSGAQRSRVHDHTTQ